LAGLGAIIAFQAPTASAQANPFDSPDLRFAMTDGEFTTALSSHNAEAVSGFLANDVQIRGFQEFLTPMQKDPKAEGEVLDRQGFLEAFSVAFARPRHLCVVASQSRGNVVAALVRDTTETGLSCSSGRTQIVTWEWSANKVKWVHFASQSLTTRAEPGPEPSGKVK
jgi:hypothetical protein